MHKNMQSAYRDFAVFMSRTLLLLKEMDGQTGIFYDCTKHKSLLLCTVYTHTHTHTVHCSFSLSPPQVWHQKVTGERLAPSNQAMSFLAQQRQSTNARRGLTRPQPR